MDRDGRPRHSGTAIIVCLFISLFLWLSFTLQEERAVTLEFPTQVTNLPDDQALAELPPSTVSVQLEGESSRLLWLYFNRPTVPLDGSEDQVSMINVMDLPSNVRALSADPGEIELQKEERLTRRVPVESRVEFSVDSAYELLNDPEIAPDSVEVSGARSLVEEIDAWQTDSVFVADIADSVAVRVALQDTLDPLVERSADEVTFVAQADRFSEAEREVDVRVEGAPGEDVVVLEPSTVRVQYRVLFDQLFDSQRTDDFYATVTYDEIRRDTTGYVEPELQVPDDFIIRDPEIEPTRLRYYVFVTGD